MPGFAPILGCKPHLLILGSMPSMVSLAQHQYYANPQNSFWWLMGGLLGFPHDLDYEAKAKLVADSRIAVWDVLYDCDRVGSADNKIVRASEQVNDFNALLRENPSLRLIAFNGTAAELIFMRHCGALLKKYNDLQCIRLPSTSPAYAAMSKEQKIRIWSNALAPWLAEVGR